MKTIVTDLSKLDELIARQYEDKIRGFAKDTFQNSWEARLHRKRGTGFKMNYEFFPSLDGHPNVLKLEDFGTKGMDKQRWKAFHSHWISTKGSWQGGIGRWGQGKTLLLYFSNVNTIITESIDSELETYRYSIRNNIGYVEKGDQLVNSDPDIFKNKLGKLATITDFFKSQKELSHVGTRIWILNIKKELASEIVNGSLEVELSESWWELIRNHKIEINVVIN